MWTDNIVNKLSKDIIYSRNDLHRIFLEEKNNLTTSTFKWVLYDLLKNGKLFRYGYDQYTLCQQDTLPAYTPIYSDKAASLIQMLSGVFPDLKFIVSEVVLLNEFLNHQIANNTIFIQVEKNVSLFVFNNLKDKYREILYNPDSKELDIYWKPDCIIILDLISQSPISHDFPHDILLEKLLVDIIAEKSIVSAFSPSELPSIFSSAIKNYQIDKRKLTRYAGRRGKAEEVERYIGGIL